MDVPAWVFAAVFVVSLGLAWGFTPLALRFAKARRILDEPGGHKGHESAIPYLGGIAIAGAFSLAVLGAAMLYRPPSGLGELAAVVGVALVLATVGLADDLRGLGVIVRFGAQLAAGIVLWAVGAGVEMTGMVPVDLLLTLVWVVGITNAFNLLDNMDGLSAGVATIAAFGFFVIAFANGQLLVAALSAALAGCAAGFLRHNFHPATIYMGDAGSLFLGFLLGYLGVKLRFDGPTSITFFVPVTVLGIAIVDTALVVANRLVHRRSPFAGGRDHISHRLVFIGVPVPAAVALIYAAGFGHAWLGLIMSRLDVGTGFLLMGLIIAGDLFVAVLLSRVPVYATSKRKHLMLQEVAEHEASGADRSSAEADGTLASRISRPSSG